MHETLKKCGDDLTRDNVMKQAANFQKFRVPLLLPGHHRQHQPDRLLSRSRRCSCQRFKGETWELFGDVMSAESSLRIAAGACDYLRHLGEGRRNCRRPFFSFPGRLFRGLCRGTISTWEEL